MVSVAPLYSDSLARSRRLACCRLHARVQPFGRRRAPARHRGRRPRQGTRSPPPAPRARLQISRLFDANHARYQAPGDRALEGAAHERRIARVPPAAGGQRRDGGLARGRHGGVVTGGRKRVGEVRRAHATAAHPSTSLRVRPLVGAVRRLRMTAAPSRAQASADAVDAARFGEGDELAAALAAGADVAWSDERGRTGGREMEKRPPVGA